MRENLDICLERIFVFEGGWAVRATEPGGAVNMGVSFATYQGWCATHKLPPPTFADLKAMPKETAEAIYLAMYATPIDFNDIPAGLDFCTLDAAVNDGVGWSLRELASICGFQISTKWPHGKDIAMAAARWAWRHQRDEIGKAIDTYCDDRLKHKEIDKPDEWPKFKAGWTTRIETVRARAKLLAGIG